MIYPGTPDVLGEKGAPSHGGGCCWVKLGASGMLSI